MIKRTLKHTLNTTIQDIGGMAMEIPKNMTKNIICFKPNLLRVWRQHQAMQRMTNPGRQILRGIKNTGKILKILYYCILTVHILSIILTWILVWTQKWKLVLFQATGNAKKEASKGESPVHFQELYEEQIASFLDTPWESWKELTTC